MKVLVIGDIHGNLPALELTLLKEKGNYDILVSHGDVVNYGPWSNECVELLQVSDCICLKGNHEEAYLKGFYPGDNALVKAFFEKTIVDFKHLNVIAEYKDFINLDNFVITHTINDTYYYPDTDVSALNLTNNTIIGHSHYAFKKRLANGNLFVNTGSIGQNRKDISCINFAMLNIEEGDVELKALSYNAIQIIDEMKSRNYPANCVEYYLKKLKR